MNKVILATMATLAATQMPAGNPNPLDADINSMPECGPSKPGCYYYKDTRCFNKGKGLTGIALLIWLLSKDKYKCPRCNYPLTKGITPCPNCGQPLQWKKSVD